MKRAFFTTFISFCALTCNAQISIPDSLSVTSIDFSIQYSDHFIPVRGGGVRRPRIPIAQPSVSLADHTLFIICGCDNTELTICDLNGNEVYTISIPEGTETICLPEWLEGTYELHIHRGNFCFYGEIEL